MSASITRLTLGLGLLGVPAIVAAAEPTDEITVQVIGDEGAKAITQQIRLPVREHKATALESAREQREAVSEQRRQFEEQAHEQRTDAVGGRGPGGR